MELGMVSDAYRPGIIWKMSMRIAEFSATLNTPPTPENNYCMYFRMWAGFSFFQTGNTHKTWKSCLGVHAQTTR